MHFKIRTAILVGLLYHLFFSRREESLDHPFPFYGKKKQEGGEKRKGRKRRTQKARERTKLKHFKI